MKPLTRNDLALFEQNHINSKTFYLEWAIDELSQLVAQIELNKVNSPIRKKYWAFIGKMNLNDTLNASIRYELDKVEALKIQHQIFLDAASDVSKSSNSRLRKIKYAMELVQQMDMALLKSKDYEAEQKPYLEEAKNLNADMKSEMTKAEKKYKTKFLIRKITYEILKRSIELVFFLILFKYEDSIKEILPFNFPIFVALSLFILDIMLTSLSDIVFHFFAKKYVLNQFQKLRSQFEML
jgi:hypothetical protein